MLFSLVLFAFLVKAGYAFIWPIEASLPADQYYTFSERYMFASKEGPFMMDQGESSIKVDMRFNVLGRTNHSAHIAMAIFSAAEGYHDSSLEGLCDGSLDPAGNSWATNVDLVTYRTKYDGTTVLRNGFLGANGTYYKRSASINHAYKVTKQGWHNVVFVLCPESFYADPNAKPLLLSTIHSEISGMQPLSHVHNLVQTYTGKDSKGTLAHSTHSVTPTSRSADSTMVRALPTVTPLGPKVDKYSPTAYMTGTIAFRNPYGYIPAELYGILPFQIARMVAYVFFGVFFVGHYIMHRDATLNLHNAFLIIFLFAAIESVLWFASYEYLNIDGVPYCCPFSSIVVGSLVLQCIRQTMSRCLLLVVCLGYGIVRPKLLPSEWIAVSVITTLYLVCTLISQSAIILYANQAHGDYGSLHSKLTPYKVPELFLDVVFLTWIYLAIGSTIRILTEFQQTVKLNMYQQLVNIIGVFVVLFTVVTFVFVIDAKVVHFLPWQTAWLEQVIWESLNFAVLAAVCVVCRPTANSQLLSYASQLPTEDPDDMYDSDEEHGIELPGPWRGSNRNYVYDQDDAEFNQSNTSTDGGGVSFVGKDNKNGKNTNGGSMGGKNDQTPTKTRNPLVLNNNNRSSPRGSLSKYSPRTNNNNNNHMHSPDKYEVGMSNFEQLPNASDEEYGLETEDL